MQPNVEGFLLWRDGGASSPASGSVGTARGKAGARQQLRQAGAAALVRASTTAELTCHGHGLSGAPHAGAARDRHGGVTRGRGGGGVVQQGEAARRNGERRRGRAGRRWHRRPHRSTAGRPSPSGMEAAVERVGERVKLGLGVNPVVTISCTNLKHMKVWRLKSIGRWIEIPFRPTYSSVLPMWPMGCFGLDAP